MAGRYNFRPLHIRGGPEIKSGEGRGGEEGRSRGGAGHLKKKKKNYSLAVTICQKLRCNQIVISTVAADRYTWCDTLQYRLVSFFVESRVWSPLLARVHAVY